MIKRAAATAAALLIFYNIASAAMPFGYELAKVIGDSGKGRHELEKPVALAVSPKGIIAVADGGRESVVLFDEDGGWLATAGGRKGRGGDIFDGPAGLCFDRRGRIWVADSGNDRLVVLREDGSVEMTYGKRGFSRGEFRGPTAVAASSTGRIYAVDAGNGRIQLIANRGSALDDWTPSDLSLRGKLKDPLDLAYTDFSDGSILIYGQSATKIDRFDLDGKWLESLDIELAVGRKPKIADVASDGRFGWVFVLDTDSNSIIVLNGRGELDQEITAPEGAVFAAIAVTAHRDIYAADKKNARILYFERK